MLADANLAAGPDKALPIVRLSRYLARKQDLDTSLEKLAGAWIARADGMSADAFAAAIEPGRKDARVVKNQQIAGLKQVREIAKQAVGVLSVASLQMQHAGLVPSGKRFLGDEVFGKMEVEFGN